MVILILFSYLLSILVSRYFDIKIQIYKDPIHYKGHIQYGLWFVPFANLVIPLLDYLNHEISCRKNDCKHNKFINWFFVGRDYKTKQDKHYERELDEFWKLKKKIENPIRDMANPNRKLDGTIKSN